MINFTDANGKTWAISLTIEAIDAINAIINTGREGQPFDLLEVADADGIFNPDLLRALIATPRRLAAVLAEAIRWERDDEAEGRELANGLRGAAIEAALAAFFDELAFFFPESQRPVLRQIIGSYHKTSVKMGAVAAEALEKTIASALLDIDCPAPAAT